MSKKPEKTIKKRINDPNKSFLNHAQNQASTMAELLGEAKGEQYLKDILNDWPHLVKGELDIFKKRKVKK